MVEEEQEKYELNVVVRVLQDWNFIKFAVV
jgi:hypothetical protein